MPEAPCSAEAGASEPASPASPEVHAVVNPLAQAVANEPEGTTHNNAPNPPRIAVKVKMKLPKKVKEAAAVRQLKQIIARMLKDEIGMRVVMWKGAMQEEMALHAAADSEGTKAEMSIPSKKRPEEAGASGDTVTAAEGGGTLDAIVLEPQPSAVVLAPKPVATFAMIGLQLRGSEQVGPSNVLVHKLFERYDLDCSGIIDSGEELSSLTVNLVFNCNLGCKVRGCGG